MSELSVGLFRHGNYQDLLVGASGIYSSIAVIFLTPVIACGAEPMLPSDCPTKGNMEVVENPSEWADQCFRTINGRLPLQNPGETSSLNRDIDLDGSPERLEVRGTGNKLKQIYVFQNSSNTFKYMGLLTAHPEFFVARDIEDNLLILNTYRRSPAEIFMQRIQYISGEFVVIREDLL